MFSRVSAMKKQQKEQNRRSGLRKASDDGEVIVKYKVSNNS